MEMLTRQQVFEKVCTHLMTQKERAEVKGETCCYRLQRGGRVLRCAAGCLISDDVYEAHNKGGKLEGLGAWDDGIRTMLTECGVSDADNDLVCDLQHIHDWSDPQDWGVALAHLAGKECFTPPVCLYPSYSN